MYISPGYVGGAHVLVELLVECGCKLLLVGCPNGVLEARAGEVHDRLFHQGRAANAPEHVVRRAFALPYVFRGVVSYHGNPHENDVMIWRLRI